MIAVTGYKFKKVQLLSGLVDMLIYNQGKLEK